MRADFVAKTIIRIPNSAGVIRYTPGDPVTAQIVEEWGLVVGEDVERGPDADTVTRPADDAPRSAWEVYAVARGTDPLQARDMDRAELVELYPADDDGPQPPEAASLPDADPGPDAGPARPAESARKAEWVEWAIEAGADPEWARASDTTKAELQAYEPGSERAPGAGGDATGQPVPSTTDGAADQGNATVGQ